MCPSDLPSLPGYTTCIIPRDVFSDNGRVVLLEKGTKVLGEYRGGMQRGQRRLFVLWNRAVTPRGVAIDLASPASDSLGRAGFGGDLDSRFFERFGSALLLSLVDDGVYIAAQGAQRNLQHPVRVPSDVPRVALQPSITPPPITRHNAAVTHDTCTTNSTTHTTRPPIRPSPRPPSHIATP